jgi:N-acetylmuramoyl-L-alanine amidase
VVDEDGQLVHMVREEQRAQHAGLSYWRGVTDCNSASIGIEIVNPGHEFGYRPFPEAQMDTVTRLVAELVRTYGIDQRNVVGHSDVAPTRKEDPGELFPWAKFAEAGIGIYHTINYGQEFHYREPFFKEGEESKDIGEMQRKLGVIGYKIQKTTIFDEQTKKVIAAFYRRFIPERIALNENHRHPDNIKWDSLADVVLNDLFQKFSA